MCTTLALGAAACAARPAAPEPRASAPASAPTDPKPRADSAVLYALPLVIMDLTREQFFAEPIAEDISPNRFLHVPILGNPSFRSVVRPNVDTLYSTGWVDVSSEPVLLTLPASQGRYYMVQCMDAWTNVFAAPGVRTLGDRAATYAIVGPDWKGSLPAGVEPLRAPTHMVWVLGRIYVRDPSDLMAARLFQHQLDLRPLGRAGDASYRGVYPRAVPANPRRKIMRELLRTLTAEAFFERFTRLTIANPAAPQDAPFVAEVLAPLGIPPGAPARWAALDEASRRALADALARVLDTFEDAGKLRRQTPVAATGWTDMAAVLAQGNYGTDYAARAGVAYIGLGANMAVDAIYMNASVDAHGQRLDGNKPYRLTFAAGSTPPVRAFWSVTLYDDKGYLVANPVERYAIKSADALVREPDGSLVIYLQPDDPGPDHRANWLPTPADQRFELSLRAYWPEDALLHGRWAPPAVVPAG